MAATLAERLRSSTRDAAAFLSPPDDDDAAPGSPSQLGLEQARAELATARALADSLSACVAEARHVAAAQRGAVAFKLQNVPPWPGPRLAAWIKRQKVAVAVRSSPRVWFVAERLRWFVAERLRWCVAERRAFLQWVEKEPGWKHGIATVVSHRHCCVPSPHERQGVRLCRGSRRSPAGSTPSSLLRAACGVVGT